MVSEDFDYQQSTFISYTKFYPCFFHKTLIIRLVKASVQLIPAQFIFHILKTEIYFPQICISSVSIQQNSISKKFKRSGCPMIKAGEFGLRGVSCISHSVFAKFPVANLPSATCQKFLTNSRERSSVA